MAIQTLHDTGSDYDIPSKYDGGVYQVATNDCIIGGVGDEFTLSYSANSLTVSFNAGSQAVIGGSFFKVVSTESITLVDNSEIYLCANIDLTQPNGYRGQFVQRTSSNMKDDNLNGSGTSRDLLLYVIRTSATGITSVEDKRDIRDKAIKDIGYGIDINNRIANQYGEYEETLTWTATEDCFAYLQGSAYGSIYIDGVLFAGAPDGNFSPNNVWLPLKKGTTVRCAGTGRNRIIAFGLKSEE